MTINIEYVEKLYPVFTKPKRVKIVIGGRGSTKSTGVADYVAAKMASGELWCCGRETHTSIEESVHRTVLDEIDRLGIEGFKETKNSIEHESGGRCFYRGLSRNVTSLKSTLSGVDGLWIEEGEDISDNTLRVLTASVRLNAKDTERKLAGEDVKMPEIIITMNRGARTGAIAKKWLKRAEPDLLRCGYYEDDLIMVVQMNYTDMPADWFEASGLEEERRDDKEKMSVAAYNHKWLGGYLDEVENSIIRPEWFDAAVDAHKRDGLVEVFRPYGAKVASFDPINGGEDNAGYILRHGSIVFKAKEARNMEIDECTQWATDLAIDDGADFFTWDGDGVGGGIKSQVSTAFSGKSITYEMFRGSLSGSAQDNANKVYQKIDDPKDKKPKTYSETFKNNRAQYYIALAERFYNTYKCVEKGQYIDPDTMISIDSDGVDDIDLLRSEVCRIPEKVNNPNGLRQILGKQEMKAMDIESPGLADSMMMSLKPPVLSVKKKTKKKPKIGVA